MIANLKPYPAMKDSGVPWLGRVPGHWHLRAVRHVTRPAKGKQPKTLYSEQGAPARAQLYLTMECLRGHKGSAKVYCVPDGLITAVKGDVLLLWDGANAGEFFIAKDGVVSSTAALLPIAGYDRRYLYFMLRQCEPRLRAFSTGMGIPHVDGGILKQLKICIPPSGEQAAIVRFLDWANGRLERAIRAKRKVIALLNEQKQAIIHRAISRGLNPSVPLKSSGILWLGDIPQHWEVLRSKYIYSEVDVRSATGQETHFSMSQRFGLIPSSHIEAKRLVSESYAGAKLCQRGDLVLNRLKAHLGVFALAPESGLVSPDYTVLHAVREVDERFFEAVYRTPACRIELRQRAKGIVQGFWRLYTDDFYDIRVPVPPVDEQKRIMTQLDIDLSGLKTTISRLEREIDLLLEYRTRLIADLATGKLDVREVATRLPEEADEPEALCETEVESEAVETDASDIDEVPEEAEA